MASPPNVESIYRLTATQEGILFHAVQNEATGLYLQQFTAVLVGELEVERFRRAWEATVARHPALRALFTWKKRPHPLQVVRRTVELPLEAVDDVGLINDGAALETFLEQDRRRGLPLDAAPVMRLTLVRGSAGRHRLIWTFHHIALDGWSMRTVLHEALGRYAGVEPGGPLPASQSHQSFVEWLGSQPEEAALSFWREHLRGFDEPTRLAVAAPAGAPFSSEGGSHRDHVLRLSTERTAALAQAARSGRVTLNTMLRAAWALTLARFSGRDDVVFGATVAGRPPELPGIEEIVGMFIHTIPVRTRIDRSQRAAAWCTSLQHDQLDALPFETTSLAAIQRASDVAPGTALFESILVMENHAAPEMTGRESGRSSLQIEEARYLERSHYPLALLVVPGPELELILVHDVAKVSPDVATQLLEFVEQTLSRLAHQPQCTVAELAALGDKELHRLEQLSRSPAQEAAVQADDVIRRIEAAALANPEGVALRCPGSDPESVTYQDLVERSQALATGLQGHGVAPGDLVGVRLQRGLDAVVTILGVLRLGGTYVPIDPESPERRVAAIEDACDLRLTVGTGGTGVQAVMGASGGRAQVAAGSGPHPESSQAPAYVLFTSGTTGIPKGVEITREALARSTAARDAFFGEAPERFLLLSPLHFDSSVAGLFWTLARGGTLVLPAPGEERDARRIAELIRSERVSHTLLLPSLYEIVLETAESGQLEALKTVIVAGEASTPALITAHHGHHGGARLVNEYGPTEATVWSTAIELAAEDAVEPVPIGRPIGDVRVHVFDEHQMPVPLGVSGELYLGGPTLARGYVGDPVHTEARFPEVGPTEMDPMNVRLYRTGDRVRFDSEGRLVFLGRLDGQVKIRGQRIELGEVEAALLGLAGVREAVALVAKGPGRQDQLMAFVSGPGATEAAADTKSLAARLSSAMRPRVIIPLESFPRTASGKIDRPALIELAAEASLQAARSAASASPREARAATNETESTLLDIWREVLGVQDIAVDQDFFGLGGDSLTSIRIISRAYKAGIEVDLADFAEHPTIEGMALAARQPASRASAEVKRAQDAPLELPLTPIQSWFFSLDLPERQHWNQSIQLEVRCGQARGPEPESGPEREPAQVAEALAQAARGLVDRHDALRLRFERSGDRWVQQVDPVEAARSRASVETVDLRGLAPNERGKRERQEALAAQTGFDLEAGRVFAARLFVSENAVRALLVAHHAVVDAVSWATIAEELLGEPRVDSRADATSAATHGAAYAKWVEALAAQADSSALRAEADEWLRMADGVETERDQDGGSVASEQTLIASLEPDLTTALLTEIHDAYGTRPREILIAALSRALSRASGRARHLIDVESHGREAEAAGAPSLDVSSTVGWLTTVWPLALTEESVPEEANRSVSIKTVKESIRTVPGNGLGFGLLAYMATDPELRRKMASMPERDLLFNYLGRVDGGDVQASPVAAIGDELAGPARSALGTRPYPLELNAWVASDSLQLRWSYSTERYSTEHVAVLGGLFLDELRGLLEHCQDPEAGGATPSDFPLAGIDQAELDRIAKLLGGAS